MNKRKIIIVTDGDQIARQALEKAAEQLGVRCISLSVGNPSPFGGPELVDLVKQAAYDPVIVMFDDCGDEKEGIGEQSLKYVATRPDIDVIGAIAVAFNCKKSKGTPVHVAIDRNGQIISSSVDKSGQIVYDQPLRILGDTLEVLNELPIPFVVGIGDLGKMQHQDEVKIGAPVTTKALQLILCKFQHGCQ
ncbi:stage V sporulation protein AE [Thermoactinomyces mirandus]|uniref:Stage V sporulation protein AE n=1 Tax=Thermoactinomyces mirandus TaxID=2756294 RepID=A0A7W2AQX1_9BACL|nr:stage V sporulation protein AE [Thermoactinomyces mirandus]MBA4600965.1 stage V sporulation protein AE [Thermoactinomyces mirandus]